MTSRRRRRAWRTAALTALLAASVGGCGQTGPLTLPGSQPVDEPAPAPQPDEAESPDDEPENER